MTTFSLDTSALIKRYVQESGTAWIQTQITPPTDHILLTARITMVEVYSALARRKREGSVPAADCTVAAQAFAVHSVTEYDFVELDLNLIALARNLLERRPLRAYDAIQLASALIAHQTLQAASLPPLRFLSADDSRNATAAAEGLMVDNPNLHP
jgi:predicted nucleic acid-binding protein